MTHIWEIILHSCLGTLVAGVLLLLQQVAVLHITPRWRYSLWSLLFLRLCTPVVCFGMMIVPDFLILMERLKTKVESGLDSVYTSAYFPLQGTWSIPLLPSATPQSITDFLFCVYWLGVIIVIGYYIIGYISLGLLLRKGCSDNKELERQVSLVAEKYQLRRCPIVSVEGLSTPFVCGILRPVLAFPKGKSYDDEVILHELIHLNQHHPLQNAFWCILRGLHWWNPLLLWVIGRICNDIESVCDCMVLEKLEEAEARKRYGEILLSMTDAKNLGFFGISTIGTSCISKGGVRLQRRISQICDFRPFHKDMNLLSICSIVVMSIPLFFGYNKIEASVSPLRNTIAEGRLNRCETVASAVETYVQSMIFHDLGLYSAVAPLSEQSVLGELEKSENEFIHPTPLPKETFYLVGEDRWVQGYLMFDMMRMYPEQSGSGQSTEIWFNSPFDEKEDYYLMNLEEIPEGYQGNLLFPILKVKDEEGDLTPLPLPFTTEEFGLQEDLSPQPFLSGFYLLPIEIHRDIDGKYVVIGDNSINHEDKSQTGVYVMPVFGEQDSLYSLFQWKYRLPFLWEEKEGEFGIFSVGEQEFFSIARSEHRYPHDSYFKNTNWTQRVIYEQKVTDHQSPNVVTLIRESREIDSLEIASILENYGNYNTFDFDTEPYLGVTRESIYSETWDGIVEYGTGGGNIFSSNEEEKVILVKNSQANPPLHGISVYLDDVLYDGIIWKE